MAHLDFIFIPVLKRIIRDHVENVPNDSGSPNLVLRSQTLRAEYTR